MPAGDIYELNVDATLAGQAITNTFHFLQIGGDGTGDGRIACDNIWPASLETSWLASLCTNYFQTNTRVRRIKPTETQALITNNVGVGAMVEEALPPQACIILREHATPSGRKGTGHIKISGCPLGDVFEGRINASLSATLTTFATNLGSPITDVATGYVFHASVYSQIDAVARPILNAFPMSRVKTVYSREVGIGQ